MDTVDRLSQYHALTEKQKRFEWDFTKGTEAYECWDEIVVGQSAAAQNQFEVTVEDILAFNRSCLETDPRYADPVAPLQHPLFPVMVVFYCVGTGIGSWIRTPGARNPGQTLEFHEPFAPGETITATVTHNDKWIRRDKHYMQDLVEMHNENGALKARWLVQLILPPTREAIATFTNA